MNLADKKELLLNKKAAHVSKTDESNKLQEEIKSAELDEKTALKLQGESDDVLSAIKSLNDEISSLSKEIDDEEKSLKALETKTNEQKEKNFIGGKNMDYLKTKEALADFARILEETGGRDRFKNAWTGRLREKGITNPEVVLPEPVVRAISDAFEKAGGIFATFSYTGLTSLKVAFNTNTTDTSRAKGHKKGTTKDEQVITLATKEIRAQYIYKYITLDRETLRENQDTGAIIKYVLEELPQRIIAEIERAAILGDGRLGDANDKISSYEAIYRTTGDTYVSYSSVGTGYNLLSEIVNMDATITAPGKRYLVMSRQTLAEIKLLANEGGLIFPIGTDIASALGFSAIFTPDFMVNGDPMVGYPKIIEYVGEAYKTVGDSTMDSYENFILAQNKNEFLMEIYSGGGLTVQKSAAVLHYQTAG